MTHWLVRVGKVWDSFKSPIVRAYLNDKRRFIETLIGYSASLVVSTIALFYIVLPLPLIPKLNTIGLTPLQTSTVILKSMRPFWLHFLALLGVIGLVRSLGEVWVIYLHVFFSIIIKARNFYTAARSREDGISQ